MTDLLDISIERDPVVAPPPRCSLIADGNGDQNVVAIITAVRQFCEAEMAGAVKLEDCRP
jgi:hypothetical protein